MGVISAVILVVIIAIIAAAIVGIRRGASGDDRPEMSVDAERGADSLPRTPYDRAR